MTTSQTRTGGEGAAAQIDAEMDCRRAASARTEARALARRRALAYGWKRESRHARRLLPRAGLALSGGGIRSATFCLGLIRGLAQNGLLRRFDYLSTVSGGGYVGAAIGRLIAKVGIDRAEAALASGDSLFLAWLRQNGRYLTPAGARDLGMAIATYMRAGIAVHLEVGFLAMLIGLVVVAPHALQAEFSLADDQAWQGWATAWWPLAVGTWLLLAPGAMAAYWPLAEAGVAPEGKPVRSTSAAQRTLHIAAALALCGVIAYLIGRPRLGSLLPFGRPSLAFAAALVLGSATLRLLSLLARLLARGDEDAYGTFGKERSRLTRSLRRINLVVVVMAAFGALDLLSRSVIGQFEGASSWWFGGGIGIGSVLVVLVRALAEPLQKMFVSADGPQARWLPQIVNAIGIGVGLLLLFAWTALVQKEVFDPDPTSVIGHLPPWACALALLSVIVGWLALTGRNRDTVNASSMHNFYRARLTRAYLSIGNSARFGEHPDRRVPNRDLRSVMSSVAEVLDGDDVRLCDYRPDHAGGPIHLINVCLNQTVDDHSGLYNADRKGLCLTACAHGVEVGSAATYDCAAVSGSLGRWTTISGAAASPGAGSYTTTGWAMLLFLVGARLGYWLDAAFAGGRKTAAALGASASAPLGWLRDTKQGLLANEAFASFGGRRQGWWYLSDGGHFDNSGVYPLLRRELDFIVLADCGADAKFEFADIENLIRKARIDFDTDIEFYAREEAAHLFPSIGTELQVLSPEDMIDNHSVRGVLLARICYHRSNPERWKLGTLVVVKPNLHDALDRDVLAYARRNPEFPHESTGDQFFDEAQWESYHRLGEDFGRNMTRQWLSRLPGWRVPIERPDRIVPLRPQPFAASDAMQSSAIPFWRRGVAATALGAGLGLGAIGTLLLPGWQALETLQKDHDRKASQVAQQKTRVNDLLDKVDAHVHGAIKAPDPRTDIPYSDAHLLAEMYDAHRAYPNDAQLRYVDLLVAEVQNACGVVDSTCPDRQSPTPLMCGAVCDPPRSNGPDPYWGYHPTVAYEWQKNRFIAFALGVGSELGVAAYRLDNRLVREQRDEPDVQTMSPPTSAPPVPIGSPTDVTPTEPVTPSAPSTTDALKACRDTNGPVAVYVQIYDEKMRDQLKSLYAAVASPDYVRVPGIENVVQTANLRGTKVPSLWREPTLVLHRPQADLACAQAIERILQPQFTRLYEGSSTSAQISIRALPVTYKSERHVIELWLPPKNMASAE